MRRQDCGSDCVGPDCEGCQNFKPLSSHAVLGEVTASDRALLIVALNYFKKSTYDSWDNCKEVQRINDLVEILKRS